MMEIEMPKIAVEESEDRSYAKIVVEPLEKGFGLTLGNALRRILLSALPGVAIKNIKFAEELGEPATIVATGGLSYFVSPVCKREIVYDRHLILKGLKAIYEKNN